MVDIVQLRRNHYTGLDADKASVTGVIGDSYAATDKDKQYYWTAGGWKTGLGYEYVPLEKAGYDFEHGDVTIDGAWHVNGLDLTGIIPDGAVAITLEVHINDNAAATQVKLRRNATTGDFNRAIVTSQVANSAHYNYPFMAIDADRLLDYFVTNGTDTLGIVITGYFI